MPFLMELLRVVLTIALFGYCYWLGFDRHAHRLRKAEAAIERVREVAHSYDHLRSDLTDAGAYNLGRFDMADQVLQYGLREHPDTPTPTEETDHA
jgi:hypothetical protein